MKPTIRMKYEQLIGIKGVMISLVGIYLNMQLKETDKESRL